MKLNRIILFVLRHRTQREIAAAVLNRKELERPDSIHAVKIAGGKEIWQMKVIAASGKEIVLSVTCTKWLRVLKNTYRHLNLA